VTVPGGVLLVDDDDAIRIAVSWALSDVGYCVTLAENGRAALDQIAASRPDLVLLDMRMPVMDGWEMAERYRQLPGPHAPIVVMTAAHDVQDRARQINADGYLAKPFDLDDLVAIVRQYVPNTRPRFD
jgi:two-component system, chemotaxis family, chemotaxis protein CheY